MQDYSRIRLLVDIDDTIENLLKAWVEWLNRKYNRTVDWKAIDEWEVANFYPGLTREQVFEPLIHDDLFWYTVEPRTDAMIYLRKLHEEEFDIYLCTINDHRTISQKYDAVVKRFFDYIPWSKVIIASKKQMLLADFLIDDAPQNLKDGMYEKILMSAGHNRKYDAEADFMHRVEDWKQAYELIHSIVDAEGD